MLSTSRVSEVVSHSPVDCPICHSRCRFRGTGVGIADGEIFRCATCAGYFLYPPKHVEYSGSGWSKERARDWSKNVRTGREHAPRILQKASQLLGRRPSSVLEIGCSTGYMGPGFVDSGCKYVGIDVDDAAVGFGRSQGLEVHALQVEELCGIDSPLSGRQFDLVISSNVLEHVQDPTKAFEVLGSVCCGLVIVIVPNPHGLYQLLKANRLLRRVMQLMLGNRREVAYSIDGYWHNLAYSKPTLLYLCRVGRLDPISLQPSGINDEVFGYVQPCERPLVRVAAGVADVLRMSSQLLLIARGSPGR